MSNRKRSNSKKPKKSSAKDTTKTHDSTIEKAAGRSGEAAKKGEVRNPEEARRPEPRSPAEARSPAEERAERFRVAANRETVEAFVVAFILALLFRAFLAEAFVIPTGSMAPTLMGAHKDITCDRCAMQFQAGASRERSGPKVESVVVGAICPNCRHVNSLDLKGTADHTTFNGDRILVNKFTYMLQEPERWDVIVFKYPGNPKQNYIKRLVGLPNETLTIRHGDVYAEKNAETGSTILRKPADTLLAMSQLVHDTDYQSETLIKSNYPSRWQPWSQGATTPPADSWKITRSAEDGLTAKLDANGDGFHWLRYFHRFPSDGQWTKAGKGESLANVNPYQSRAITDFYAYDSYIQVNSRAVYVRPPEMITFTRGLKQGKITSYSAGEFSPRYESGGDMDQFDGISMWGGQDNGRDQFGRDGMHWVGDLIVAADIETNADCKQIQLEIVEAGVKYRCAIDLQDGKAQLAIDDGQRREFDGGDESPSADSGVVAGSRDHIRLSNCDDQLLLWVNDSLISFDGPTSFNARAFRNDLENRPRYSPADPLDAAPVGIAVRGGTSTIHHMEIRRDKYYIAASNGNSSGINDYEMGQMYRSTGRGMPLHEIQSVFKTPEKWEKFVGWQARRSVTFEMQEDQFFPMGDNSPESLDARIWAGTKQRLRLPRKVNEDAWKWGDKSYVPRDLLVGKALLVFWPHSWNEPVPMTPNFKRMKRIR